MKILYAASNREGAKIQLTRFIQAIEGKGYNLKIAAYNTPGPTLSIDWNLEALKDIWYPDILSFDNEKLETYYSQVKYFDPDIIISDLEPFTSYIAPQLNKKIWQVSPSLLHHATPHKEKISTGLFRYYPHLFNKPATMQRLKNAIVNADRKLVYHHFGDTNNFELIPGFEWVRPYHLIGKYSRPCEHDVVICTLRNNKKIINQVRNTKDVVLFSTFLDETFSDVILKSVYDAPEYACNLKNCRQYITQGHTDFLADAFYNKKIPNIITNFEDPECIMNTLYSQKFNIDTVIYNSRSKFLHEMLEEI